MHSTACTPPSCKRMVARLEQHAHDAPAVASPSATVVSHGPQERGPEQRHRDSPMPQRRIDGHAQSYQLSAMSFLHAQARPGLVYPKSKLWHYAKRRFFVTLNLRYIHRVLNVDEIKN